jgi:hypothetical protein
VPSASTTASPHAVVSVRGRKARTRLRRADVDDVLPPSVRAVREVADLADICLEGVQIAVLPRAIDPVIARWLDTAASERALGRGLRTAVRAGETIGLDDLPPGAGRDALASDLAFLATLCVDLLDCDRVGLRVEITASATCPRFHVDRTGLRLLCTYRGPGTEWLADEDADRSRLGAGAAGRPDACSGLLRSGARIRTVPPFAVVLLKGSAWPGNEARGAIHRSPAVPCGAGPRVLVALDPLWD